MNPQRTSSEPPRQPSPDKKLKDALRATYPRINTHGGNRSLLVAVGIEIPLSPKDEEAATTSLTPRQWHDYQIALIKERYIRIRSISEEDRIALLSLL